MTSIRTRRSSLSRDSRSRSPPLGKPAAGTASADAAGTDTTKPRAAGAAAEPIALDAPSPPSSGRNRACRSLPASVQTTGTVAFNGDRSTQVLAPVSGPITRILVNPGAYVRRGAALATVTSPDFAAALADYRKAQSP